jgi:hypothetical protein
LDATLAQQSHPDTDPILVQTFNKQFQRCVDSRGGKRRLLEVTATTTTSSSSSTSPAPPATCGWSDHGEGAAAQDPKGVPPMSALNALDGARGKIQRLVPTRRA